MELDLTIFEKYVLNEYLDLFNFELNDKVNITEAEFILNFLKRNEERNCMQKDQFDNFEFPFTENDFNKPYLDIFILELLEKYKLEKRNLWGNNFEFAFILSHDVDLVNKNHYKQDFRASLKHLFKQKGISKLNSILHFLLIFRNLFVRLFEGKDRLWDYDKWIEIEKKFNCKSVYFFFVRPKFKNLHLFDCDFKFKDRFKLYGKKVNVYDYIKILKEKGDEIGLHGSFYASLNSDLIKEQKENLTSASLQIDSYRNHYLHFDINLTPLALSKSNILIDSTLGFNRNVGFRAGTCMPFYFYEEKFHKPVLEVPQIIMDSALFLSNSLELNLELAKTKVDKIIDHCSSVGGVLTVNFHPDKISKPYYFEIYIYIIERCKSQKGKNILFNELSNYLYKK
jgi:hypothetical protein